MIICLDKENIQLSESVLETMIEQLQMRQQHQAPFFKPISASPKTPSPPTTLSTSPFHRSAFWELNGVCFTQPLSQ
jgi:hypothetical protein